MSNGSVSISAACVRDLSRPDTFRDRANRRASERHARLSTDRTPSAGRPCGRLVIGTWEIDTLPRVTRTRSAVINRVMNRAQGRDHLSCDRSINGSSTLHAHISEVKEQKFSSLLTLLFRWDERRMLLIIIATKKYWIRRKWILILISSTITPSVSHILFYSYFI